jgi:hemerythrin
MKKVEDTKKITDEQLEVITKHQKDLNKSLTNIGFLETQKHSLLHE